MTSSLIASAILAASCALAMAQPKPAPVTARVLKLSVTDQSLLITADAGNSKGVTKEWKCQLVQVDSGAAATGGECMVIRIDKATTVVKSTLTLDEAKQVRVRLSPP